MTEKYDYGKMLPDRNDTDIPSQVQWFLSVCELANVWHEWLEDNIETAEDQFCEGVVDYWYNYDLMKEPHMDMISNIGIRQQKRIAYQKGAIVGYELAKRFK